MPKVAIIANPHSKSNRDNPNFLRELEASASTNQQICITDDLDDLKKTVPRLIDEGTEIIGICGGDGSILHVVNLIYHHARKSLPCKIAVLGGGTMNTVAKSLGLRFGYKEACQRFLKMTQDSDSSDELPATTIHPIIVEDRLGFLYADGSFVRILEQFYENKGGLKEVAGLSFKLIVSALVQSKFFRSIVLDHPIKVSGASKEVLMDAKSLGVIAASIDTLPLNFPLLAKRPENSLDFQLLTVNCKPNQLLYYLPWLMVSAKDRSSKLRFFKRGESFVVTAAEPFTYTLDGEVFKSKKNTLSLERGPELAIVTI